MNCLQAASWGRYGKDFTEYENKKEIKDQRTVVLRTAPLTILAV